MRAPAAAALCLPMAFSMEAAALRGSTQRGDRLPLHAAGGSDGGWVHPPRLVLLAVACYTLLAGAQGAWWFVHLKRTGSCQADNEVRCGIWAMMLLAAPSACRGMLAAFHSPPNLL